MRCDVMDWEYVNEFIDELLTAYVKNHNLKIDHDVKWKIDGENRTIDPLITGLFPSGMIVTTNSVGNWIMDLENPNPIKQNVLHKLIQLCVFRHMAGDWGKLCYEDMYANETALRDGERLMSVYEIEDKTIWIITEYDRSVTTVLFPEDY